MKQQPAFTTILDRDFPMPQRAGPNSHWGPPGTKIPDMRPTRYFHAFLSSAKQRRDPFERDSAIKAARQFEHGPVATALGLSALSTIVKPAQLHACTWAQSEPLGWASDRFAETMTHRQWQAARQALNQVEVAIATEGGIYATRVRIVLCALGHVSAGPQTYRDCGVDCPGTVEDLYKATQVAPHDID